MTDPQSQKDARDAETPPDEHTPNAPAETPQTPPDEPSIERTDPAARAAATRVELRDTQAERDALAAQLTAAHRREVESVLNAAGSGGVNVPPLARAADIWDVLKADPDQFHDADTGDLDVPALADYVTEQTLGRPYLHRSALTSEPSRADKWIENAIRKGSSASADTGSAWKAALTRD